MPLRARFQYLMLLVIPNTVHILAVYGNRIRFILCGHITIKPHPSPLKGDPLSVFFNTINLYLEIKSRYGGHVIK